VTATRPTGLHDVDSRKRLVTLLVGGVVAAALMTGQAATES
jgi:hypothetical protein